MKFNIISQNKINKNIFYLTIFIGIILQLLYLFQFNDYYDDWNFFYTVDPNVSNDETWQRHYYGDRGDAILKEAFPWNFTYFIKYNLKLIGYTIEKTHYFLLFFSILSYFFLFKIIYLISKDFKFLNLVFILFLTNLFLIRELNAFRPHSVTMFLSFLSIYFFILIFINDKYKKKYFFIYIISTTLMLSFWPHSLALFGGHCIFLLINFFKKKNLLICFLSPLVIVTLYTLLNYKYLFYIAIDNSWSYTPLNLNFFLNFFFRSFFGSIIFGGFMLLAFSVYLFKEIQTNLYAYKKNNLSKLPILEINIKNFILINILSIYMLSIGYSLLKESVMAPKYLLILIPLIIIWISIKINKNKKNFFYVLIVIFTSVNTVYFWKDLPIDRPPMKEVLKIIGNEKINIIYTTESIVFNNYLSHYNHAVVNQFEIMKLKNIDKINVNKKFAIVCLNYPRFAVGDTYADLVESKCKNIKKNNNLQILKKIQIPDFLILITKYNY